MDSTIHTCIQIFQNNNTEKDRTIRKREGEKDSSGVVSDVEEMCFEMTFERLQ